MRGAIWTLLHYSIHDSRKISINKNKNVECLQCLHGVCRRLSFECWMLNVVIPFDIGKCNLVRGRSRNARISLILYLFEYIIWHVKLPAHKHSQIHKTQHTSTCPMFCTAHRTHPLEVFSWFFDDRPNNNLPYRNFVIYYAAFIIMPEPNHVACVRACVKNII